MFFVIPKMPSKTFVMLYKKKLPDHFNFCLGQCCIRHVREHGRGAEDGATSTHITQGAPGQLDQGTVSFTSGMWIRIDRMRIRIQDDKITNLISTHLLRRKKNQIWT